MKAGIVAELCRSMFYNGRIVSDDQKLDLEDFEQMVFASLGDTARIEWYQEAQRGNQDFWFSPSIITEDFKVMKVGRKLIVDISERKLFNLPRAAGVIRVYPAGDCEDTWDDDLEKIAPGGEYFYGNPKQIDDTGMKVYVPKGNILEVYGVKEGDKLSLDYIPNDLDMEIPDGLANVIIKDILAETAPIQARSVDIREDGNPNVNTYKQRLDNPAGL